MYIPEICTILIILALSILIIKKLKTKKSLPDFSGKSLEDIRLILGYEYSRKGNSVIWLIDGCRLELEFDENENFLYIKSQEFASGNQKNKL